MSFYCDTHKTKVYGCGSAHRYCDTNPQKAYAELYPDAPPIPAEWQAWGDNVRNVRRLRHGFVRYEILKPRPSLVGRALLWDCWYVRVMDEEGNIVVSAKI